MDPVRLLQGLSTAHLLMLSVAVVSVLAFASKRLQRLLVLIPQRVVRGEVHRLLTAGWVHGDWAHLAVNLFVLWMFAGRAIKTFGQLVFVVVYVSAVVAAFIPTVIRFRKNPRYSSLGASGAVAAVMFSAILVDPNLKMYLLLIPIPIPGLVFGLLYLAYSAWHSRGSGDNINHDAHLSGALYGVLVTTVWAPTQVERTIRIWLTQVGL